jgi:hypothetical protein
VLSVLTARALQRGVTDTSRQAIGAVDRDATRAQHPGRRRSRNDVGALQSGRASYARALDRVHNLSRLRDEIGIAADHFKGG